jgi:hypothetical protein
MGNLDGGAPLLGTLEGVYRKALEMGRSIGVLLGNLKEGSYTGDIER